MGPLNLPPLLTFGGHHWRPVQTCSLEDLFPYLHQYWHLVVATKTHTFDKWAVCMLLERILVNFLGDPILDQTLDLTWDIFFGFTLCEPLMLCNKTMLQLEFNWFWCLIKTNVGKRKICSVKNITSSQGLNLGPLVIHSDVYLTKVIWQVLIEEYLTLLVLVHQLTIAPRWFCWNQ